MMKNTTCNSSKHDAEASALANSPHYISRPCNLHSFMLKGFQRNSETFKDIYAIEKKIP